MVTVVRLSGAQKMKTRASRVEWERRSAQPFDASAKTRQDGGRKTALNPDIARWKAICRPAADDR